MFNDKIPTNLSLLSQIWWFNIESNFIVERKKKKIPTIFILYNQREHCYNQISLEKKWSHFISDDKVYKWR